jgi:hypothetical protein
MKACRQCGELKSLAGFYRHPGMLDGHLHRCKDCHKANMRKRHHEKRADPEWLQSERGRGREKYQRLGYRDRYPNTNRESARAWALRNPEKRRAHSDVHAALRSGRLDKPGACEECGTTDEKLHGHHEDYHRPLEVEWLCPPCHGARHRKAVA